MITYTLKVADIRKETSDTLTLCFKQPALRKIKYKAGQYLTLMFRINGRRYVRPYSFSSTPLVDSLLEVTIKRVQNGIVSNHIHDQVEIGDVIEVMEPMGEFILDDNPNISTVCFWGVGSGITPLMSLIKSILHSDVSKKVVLVYGNRNFDTTIFSRLIDVLLVEYPDQFQVWHFHTQLSLRHENPHIIEGRINKDYAIEILKGIDVINTGHYICGPAGLKESVNEALAIFGIDRGKIFSEEFELIKDPGDFDSIFTENIRLKFQGGEHELEIVKGKSILEAALDSGLELPYSCQTGNCSTCKGICLEGEIKMIGLTKKRIDLKPNEFLLCCSHPVTDNVYIEI